MNSTKEEVCGHGDNNKELWVCNAIAYNFVYLLDT